MSLVLNEQELRGYEQSTASPLDLEWSFLRSVPGTMWNLMGGEGGGGKAGRGWAEERKIKRTINISQTLKCKSFVCVPLGPNLLLPPFWDEREKNRLAESFPLWSVLVWCGVILKPSLDMR